MAQPNHYNHHELGPDAAAQPPYIVDGQTIDTNEGRLDYQVAPEGIGLATRVYHLARRRFERGISIHANVEYVDQDHGAQPTQENIEQDTEALTPQEEKLITLTPEIQPGETTDEALWRNAVMHTLGKRFLDPASLQKRFSQLSSLETTKLVSEMRTRGILGQHSRIGYEVIQRFGDSPEAIRTAALHFARARNHITNNLIEQLNAAHQERLHAQGNNKNIRNTYLQAQKEAAAEIENYTIDVDAARKSLNIPIPDMHRIVNTLEHIGFLRVPIVDRGDDFDPQSDFFRGNRKWTQLYPQMERVGSNALLISTPTESQNALENVFHAFPAPYDPTEVVLPGIRHPQRSESPRQNQASPATNELDPLGMSDEEKKRHLAADAAVSEAVRDERRGKPKLNPTAFRKLTARIRKEIYQEYFGDHTDEEVKTRYQAILALQKQARREAQQDNDSQ
jgi:hypothetical protein